MRRLKNRPPSGLTLTRSVSEGLLPLPSLTLRVSVERPPDVSDAAVGGLNFSKSKSRVSRTRRRRGGMSLILVMTAVSMSMLLTYAAISSQTRGLQIRQNVNRQELAHRAAESGATIALAKLQASDWTEVTESVSGILENDSQGTASYAVEFRTIDGQTSPAAYPTSQGQTNLTENRSVFNSTSPGLTSDSANTAASATKQAFQLLVRSTGKWQSATDITDFVTDVVEVGVELQPRVPGRTLLPADSASAIDVMPNSANYDTIQTYALFTTTGSNDNPSLTLQPGDRIDGSVWLNTGLDLFTGPNWNGSTRNDYLLSVGSRYAPTIGGQPALQHPHPFGGGVTTLNSLNTSDQTDLEKLNVPHQTASSSLVAPTVSFTAWQTYQLYVGGFIYDAEKLTTETLAKAILRPSQRNPLGVFYRDGNLELDDNVVIQGTLVCSGRVTVSGNNVFLTGLNWRDADGAALLSNATIFPRLPSIVARELKFERNTRATVDGAVLLTSTVTDSGGSYELLDATNIDIAGSEATSVPLRQPFSQVQLPNDVNLSKVTGNCQHAIWLADGNSGNWYPISDVDSANRRLTVVGEASRPSPVSFRVRRQRLRFTDLRGPLLTPRLKLTMAWEWTLSNGLWNSLHSIWKLLIQIQSNNGFPQTPFVDWLADPATFAGWGDSYDTLGLSLEPTFHLSPLAGVTYRDSLPLFRGYSPASGSTSSPMSNTSPGSTSQLSDFAGYRWRVLFWRRLH